MMQIEMIQHYCGFRNNNETWLPGAIKSVPGDLDQEAADDLIERGYAKAVKAEQQLTRSAEASVKVTEIIATRRKEK